jgi:hypothetical protein
MDILTHLKSKRKRQRNKAPFKKNVFNNISRVVARYGLEKNFLAALENVDNAFLEKKLNSNRVRVKEALEGPLFSLVSQEEYTLTLSIMHKIDNPYLLFAHSPGEILLCAPLYRLNPTIAPEKLARYHFETLLLHERAKTNNQPSDLS